MMFKPTLHTMPLAGAGVAILAALAMPLLWTEVACTGEHPGVPESTRFAKGETHESARTIEPRRAEVQEPDKPPPQLSLMLRPPTVVAPEHQLETSVKELNDRLRLLWTELTTLRNDLRNRVAKADDDAKRKLDAGIGSIGAELDRLEKWVGDYQAKIERRKPGEEAPLPDRPLLPDKVPPAYDASDDQAQNDKMMKALLMLAGTALCIYMPAACPFVAAVFAALGIQGPGGATEAYQNAAALEQTVAGTPVAAAQLGRLHQWLSDKQFDPQLAALVLQGFQNQGHNQNPDVEKHAAQIAGELSKKFGTLGQHERNLVDLIRDQQPDARRAALDTLMTRGSGDRLEPVFASSVQKILVAAALQRLDHEKPGVFRKYWENYLIRVTPLAMTRRRQRRERRGESAINVLGPVRRRIAAAMSARGYLRLDQKTRSYLLRYILVTMVAACIFMALLSHVIRFSSFRAGLLGHLAIGVAVGTALGVLLYFIIVSLAEETK